MSQSEKGISPDEYAKRASKFVSLRLINAWAYGAGFGMGLGAVALRTDNLKYVGVAAIGLTTASMMKFMVDTEKRIEEESQVIYRKGYEDGKSGKEIVVVEPTQFDEALQANSDVFNNPTDKSSPGVL